MQDRYVRRRVGYVATQCCGPPPVGGFVVRANGALWVPVSLGYESLVCFSATIDSFEPRGSN
eukprot:scaffold1384_cov116-Cylindrotheca_fusiformis.AAC.44